MNRYVFLRFPKGKPKAVTLSYDDGVAYDIKFSDIISKVSEVRHMGYHRKHYPEDNRTYEELIKEEREKREAEVEKMMREYFEEMERKYG